MKKHILIMGLFLLLLPIVQANAEIELGAGSGGDSESKPTTYTVAVGDTLWAIAKNHSVSMEDLITWNNLNSTTIYPSQQLKIGTKPEPVTKEKAASKTYTVKGGDTLIDIARDHDIALEELIRVNAISSYLIYPGSEIIIKDADITKSFSEDAALTTINDERIQGLVNSSPIEADSVNAQENLQSAKTPSKRTVAAQSPKPPTSSSKEMTVTATAYTAYCTGCSGTTYTGINLRANPNQKVIAVDPNVIPLGSKVWVEGYGEAIAGDIGGAIKGNIIDLFMEHKKDAINWGRRTVTIKVLD